MQKKPGISISSSKDKAFDKFVGLRKGYEPKVNMFQTSGYGISDEICTAAIAYACHTARQELIQQ
jgi:hypothetical protein